MPRLPHQVHPAPLGMNASANPALLPTTQARRIVNFRADRMGSLRGCLKYTDLHTFGSAPDGVAFYYGETEAEDRILVVAGGFLYAGVPGPNNAADLSDWIFSAVGSGFEVGKAVRFAAFQEETILVQEGGLQPKRFDGTNLYQLGITPPAAPTVLTDTPSGGAVGNKTGEISYSYSYFDSKFRESDVSEETEIDYDAAANVGKSGRIHVDYGTDPQIAGAYVYATTDGGSTKYRIATLTRADAEYVYEDNSADEVVSAAGAVQAPSPGEYAIPNPASCVAVHKRRLVMNDVENPKILQISALDNPSQWSSVTYFTTDGTRLSIGTHQGAGINALAAFGSLLMVTTRAEMLQMWGDDPSVGRRPFELRAIHKMGVLAPGSFVRCNNEVVGLLDDGQVWAMSGEEGFPLKVLSADIETRLQAHSATELEAAQGAFADNCYLLSVGDTLYIFDFTTSAWVMAQ